MESLLFDYGGTLDGDGQTWLERFLAIYKEAGIDVDRDTFAPAFYRSDDTLAQRHALKGLSLEETVELQVGQVLEELAPKRPDLRPIIAQRFVAASRQAFRRQRPALERLARRHRLGVVSNFYGNLESVLRSEGLLELFSAVADSGVVGALKPDAALFQHALSRLEASPAQAVMIGDSIPRDMRGAENLSMRHVLIGDGSRRCCAEGRVARSVCELEETLAAAALP